MALPEKVRTAAQIYLLRDPESQVPAAIVQMREHAGLTQDALARRLSRSRATVGAWERGLNLPPRSTDTMLLDACKVEYSEVRDLLPEASIDAILTPSAYRRRDPDELEFEWWQTKRGDALLALYDRGVKGGSDVAIKILFDRMDKTERAYLAKTGQRDVTPGRKQSEWVKKALKAIVQRDEEREKANALEKPNTTTDGVDQLQKD